MTVSPRNRDFIAGFQSGSYESIRQLCDWHYAPLIDFAQQLTLNNWIGHAIVLDSFVKLVQMRDQFDNEANIKAFLYITVRNRCHAFMQSGVAPEEDGFKPGNGEGIEQLRKDADALPEKCRKVFQYFYTKRLRVNEIAEQLELEQATVVQLREKALRILCDQYSTPVMIYFLAVAAS